MEDTAEDFFALAVGTRVDEYRIISVIGQGSFGITYLAEDVNLGFRFALKEYLPGEWAVRDSTRSVRPKSAGVRKNFDWGMDAFLKEARTLASISHPNIVKVRRFFRANGTAYIVMEFIQGRTFSDVLANDFPTGGYPSSPLKALLLSLLDGLSAVHRAGVIHRDIKPGNILIEPNGNPILVDFGAARNFHRTVSSGMTVILTPGFAPIEQYSEGDEQGPFTDIYSLGAVAYRALTGGAPVEPFKRLTGKPFKSATLVGAGKYPIPLLSAIDWAIEVAAKDRPQSASELSALLRTEDFDGTKAIDGSSPFGQVRARPSRHDSLLVTFARRRLGSRRKIVQISVVVGVVGATIIVFASYRGIWFEPLTPNFVERAGSNDSVKSRSGDKNAEAAAKKIAERKAAEAVAQQEAERKAAEAAAQQEAERKAAEVAAQQEAERKAAEAAAQQEAEKKAAEAAAQQEAERKAAEAAAQQEAERKAAEAAAQQEAERKAAEAAAQQEAERKATEAAAQQEAERKAAKAAAKREAEAAAVAAKREAQRRATEAAAKQEADRKAADAAAKREADKKAAAAAKRDANSKTEVTTTTSSVSPTFVCVDSVFLTKYQPLADGTCYAKDRLEPSNPPTVRCSLSDPACIPGPNDPYVHRGLVPPSPPPAAPEPSTAKANSSQSPPAAVTALAVPPEKPGGKYEGNWIGEAGWQAAPNCGPFRLRATVNGNIISGKIRLGSIGPPWSGDANRDYLSFTSTITGEGKFDSTASQYSVGGLFVFDGTDFHLHLTVSGSSCKSTTTAWRERR